MYAFEKEILKRENPAIFCSYPYKVIPLSDQAKIAFAKHNKKSGPMESNANTVKKYLNVEKKPFVGMVSFPFDDPNEANFIRETKSRAIWKMTESGVPGVFHHDSGIKSYYVTLHEGKDFKIEVGEKIIHEQPQSLTFEDIKTL
ncbi:hypothetical protein GJU41_22545 [Bacillus idriensis]|uniref:Uncharacterized protein n=1 Tax=Metabacillus idriensis TaxID=324768 RepID=A0A6I2MI21_9BACI|nr:hypothetical protein [Metabacillus idriensis]MRX56726.1 hypothetical protein [Metabacillus idriensis]